MLVSDENRLPGDTKNLVEGDVYGTSIMARDIAGGITVTNVFEERAQLGSFVVSELSVAIPDNLLRHKLRGRDDLIAELTALAGTEGGYFVLNGAGGCGKSALAAAVGDKVRADHIVWWVDGTTRDTLVSGLFEVAVQAGASRVEAREVWRNGESAKDLLWRALRRSNNSPWLLIVDNADEPAVLEGWLQEPPAGNTVLVTSRDRRPAVWARHVIMREVLPISYADGAAVLMALAPGAGSAAEAQRLANRLGGLPLVLMLVGTYLARTGTGPALPESHHPRSFSEYVAALDTEFPDAISSLGDQILVRTWERSLDLLELQGVPAARPLFRLLAFLMTPVVPAVLLVPSVLRLAPRFFPGLEVSDLENAVDGLIGFGLLDHLRTGVAPTRVDAFVLHTLVGEITRTQVDAYEDVALYRTLRVAALHRAVTDHDPADHATWPVWQLLLPLCTFTDEDLEYASGDEYLLHAYVAFHAARYATRAGLWTTAEELYQTSLSLWGKRVPATNPDVIIVRQNLALLKVEQGRYAEAESDLRDVLAAATATLGADNPTTLATRHELARVLLKRGNYDLAAQEFSALVPRMSHVLGIENEFTLVARLERAKARRDLGDLDFAQAEFEELVMTMSRVLGANSAETLIARHELAEMLVRRGWLADARAMLIDILELGETNPGLRSPQHTDHPLQPGRDRYGTGQDRRSRYRLAGHRRRVGPDGRGEPPECAFRAWRTGENSDGEG